MERRKMKLIYVFVVSLLTSCNYQQVEFDKEKWNERDDMFYANREKMVADLMKNYLKKGMTYKEVINLLGTPENYHNDHSNTIAYEIMVHYDWNIDPQKGKILYIDFTSDSIVKDIKFDEWKH